MGSPTLSLVVLAWNNRSLTERCVASLRENTGVAYELIIVDNGSEAPAAMFASEAADIPVMNATNLGFAAGMNSGLRRASGDYVCFINNDTRFPDRWAELLLETFADNPRAGIVLPAVTAAGNPVSVRTEPGTAVVNLVPFAEFPSGVVYVTPRTLISDLGGWNEAYERASAEDLDLAFTVWAHGYEIVLDERVLVEHVSQASMRVIPNLDDLYRQNLEQFLDRWEDPTDVTRMLEEIDEESFRTNLGRAQTAVIWIRRMLQARNDAAKRERGSPDR